MATWLVTGGAGFIGGNFVLNAMKQGHRIINLDALTYAGNLDTLASLEGNGDHLFVHGNLCDQQLVSALLAEHQPEAVLNFAAESHVDRSIDNPGAFVQTNLFGTFSLLEAVLSYWQTLSGVQRERFRLLHVSTDEVYGSLGDSGRFTEESPYAPNSPYSATKAGSDHLVRAYYHTYQLPVLTTHCSNNYGPYHFPEKLIPLMINRAVNDQSLPIYGDGRHVRDWLYVEDHCDALSTVLAQGQPGQTYNIGGHAERENRQVVQTVCQLLDDLAPRHDGRSYTQQITHVADRPGHDRRYAIDATKMMTQLGWRPKHSFEQGMASTVHWYLNHQPWVQRVLDGRYRLERIGLSQTD